MKTGSGGREKEPGCLGFLMVVRKYESESVAVDEALCIQGIRCGKGPVEIMK